MLTAFKQYQKVNWKDILYIPAIMGGSFLFGQFLLALVMASEGPQEWFPIASLFAALIGIVMLIFLNGIGFSQGYRLALTMSRRRKPLLGVAVLNGLLYGTATVALMIPLLGLDLLIARFGYRVPEQAALAFLRQLLRSPWILLAAVPPLTCSSIFVGAIHSRLNPKVSVLLFVFFTCSVNLISPTMEHIAEHPDSPISRIFRLLASVPPAAWIAAAVLLLLGMLWAGLRMLYKLRAEI